MMKSIVWILFNKKCETEIERNKKKEGVERECQRYRLIRNKVTTPANPAASHWSLLTLVF